MDIGIINKVFIIDDQYKEVAPIIQALAKKGVPTIYWNGHIDTKPDAPINGVRLVILDMRFSLGVNEPRSINANLFMLLKSAISQENGPYILFIWSKHDNEYLQFFKEELSNEPDVPKPYLIINMEKNKFIRITSQKNEAYNEIASTLEERGENPNIKDEILNTLENEGFFSMIEIIEPKENIIDELICTLDEKLKEANALSILFMWENLVNISANKLVNDISNYSEPGEDWDNNLKTLIQNLAEANGGKSLGTAPKEFLFNSLSSLNHMLPDELLNELFNTHISEDAFSFIHNPAIMETIDGNTYSISKSKKGFVVKKGNTDYESFNCLSKIQDDIHRTICETLYNKYLHFLSNSNFKLLCERSTPIDMNKPGGIYQFENSELLMELSNSIFKNKDDIPITTNSLIMLDISASCDYAQNKLKRVRMLPGIMIDHTYSLNITNAEDIYCTPEMSFNGRMFKIAFSFHYITNVSRDILSEKSKLFSFRELLLTEIKHKLSTHISRVGIINL